MTWEIALVLIVIVVALYLFVTEKFGIDTISIMIMLILMVTGILTPQEGFAGFTNPATITVTSMFVISAAIYKSGALSGVMKVLNLLGRKSYLLTVLVLMLVAGLLSAFMNDTAVVAILLPVTLSIAKRTKINPSRLLMPLSFGALLGGICTVIGTSTNILVSGIVERAGLPPIEMFEMTDAGICFLGAGILYMLFVGSWLMPKRNEKDSLAEEYEMSEYLTEIVLMPEAKSIGKKIKDAPLTRNFDIKILALVRNGITLSPYPDLVLHENDVLKVNCNIEMLKSLREKEGIRLRTENKYKAEDILNGFVSFVEILIPSNSRIDNHSLREYNFRARFNGANVLAIRHRNDVVHEKFGEMKLKAGDVLLVAADSENISLLKRSEDLLIISETDHRPFNLRNMLYIILIVAGVVLSASFNIAPIMLTATVGVVTLIALKFLNTAEAYESIDWKVVFMLAGILSLGAALEKTGASGLLARGLVTTVGAWGPHALLVALFGITFMATNFMSNNATAALLTPIAINTALTMGIDSRPLIMAIAFAASLSFMTPMGYQTNTMIYAPGNYRFKDFLLVGTPLNILLWILAAFIIPYFFPF